MSEKLALKLSNNVEELERITAAVEALAEQEDWPPAFTFRVNLVLEEFGINIINYGHSESSQDFEITLTSEVDTLVIEFSDEGQPFNPLEDAAPPDTGANLEDRPIGGLGLFLVREMTEQMHYRRENSKNHSTMVMRKTE